MHGLYDIRPLVEYQRLLVNGSMDERILVDFDSGRPSSWETNSFLTVTRCALHFVRLDAAPLLTVNELPRFSPVNLNILAVPPPPRIERPYFG